MKKLFLTLVAIIAMLHFSFAQTPTPTNLFPDTGRTGIGTVTPTALLHVVGFSTPTIKISNPSSSDGSTAALFFGLSIYPNYNTVGARIYSIRTNSPTNGNSDLAFSTSNGSTQNEGFRLLSSGNVGIGTTDPGTYKLAVNGGIHAKQVNVDLTGWSDYVFNPNYNLPPLAEVKTYIDKNHHLPEIPSEQEVINKGIDLGEMNKVLVKKVEELTLYLLEQQKVNQKQLETNKTQQQQIDELKTQVSLLINISNKK